MVGRRIGERAGWPVERVASLGNWIEAALGTLLITTDLGPGGPWACENLQALDRYWKLAVEHGETHAARVLLRESSLTQSEIAIVYRDKLKALATQGQAAMATASAASSAASEPNPAPR